VAKTKVRSSGSGGFAKAGGRVHVTHKATPNKGYGGMGTPGSDVGKQTSKPARPK
jgi:hypothetical protein